jgi:predicted RNase H-like HicB family nuclease
MDTAFQVRVSIGRQEDGLWRVEVPDLPGCWVDAETLTQALSDIQEVIALSVDYRNELGLPLPSSLTPLPEEPISVDIPILLGEHHQRVKPIRARQLKLLPK